jgi:hypothetical protein
MIMGIAYESKFQSGDPIARNLRRRVHGSPPEQDRVISLSTSVTRGGGSYGHDDDYAGG